MLKLKLYPYACFWLAVFMLISPVFSAASDRKNFEGIDASAELGTFYLVNTSLERISDLNMWIQSEVEAGKVSLDKGRQAQNIWISLQQYLANQGAEIRQVENKVMQSEGNVRLKAARDLTRKVVEQERVLISVYLALKQTANSEGFNGEELIPEQKQTTAIKKETPSESAVVEKEAATGGSGVKIKFSRTDALIKDLE